jgi:uncharacterized RmlC-like cupin family protein
VTRSSQGVVLVETPVSIAAHHQVPYFVGISRETAGARGICMHRIVIPPGAATAPHSHVGDESAIYVLEGEVEILHGPGLRERLVARAGEFLYIDADWPHQARNPSSDQPAIGLVARNNGDEQEAVVPYDPAAGATAHP